MSHKPEMIHTQVGATSHKDKTTQQNPQVIHQCQHPHPSPHLQKTEGEEKKEKKETRDKKETEICRPDCDVAMDTSGNHKAKNLFGSAVV